VSVGKQRERCTVVYQYEPDGSQRLKHKMAPSQLSSTSVATTAVMIVVGSEKNLGSRSKYSLIY
jgi:hypothetical protein